MPFISDYSDCKPELFVSRMMSIGSKKIRTRKRRRKRRRSITGRVNCNSLVLMLELRDGEDKRIILVGRQTAVKNDSLATK